MCEKNGLLIAVEKRIHNTVCTLSGLFGFEDSMTGERSLIPVNLYLYTVAEAEISDETLYSEMFIYAHNMKYHSPTKYNG